MLPLQPAAPAAETTPPDLETEQPPAFEQPEDHAPQATGTTTGLPTELITLQRDPSGRCDCSSLMQRAYGVAGIQITRTTYTQIHDGRAVPANAKSLQPGDLVFTEGSATRPEHVAMAIGDGLLVHAPKPGRVVEVAKVATHGTILVVRRIV